MFVDDGVKVWLTIANALFVLFFKFKGKGVADL